MTGAAGAGEVPDSQGSGVPGQPMLIIMSGPSGVGKDAVLKRMRESGLPFHFTVTATTRPKRAMETDGVDYIFLTKREFVLRALRQEFLEQAEVYGNFYGVPRQQVRDAMSAGKDVIIKADVQGARTIRKEAPEALAIFLAPTGIEDLERRLTDRLTESPEALALRLQTAADEMKEAEEFDHVVYNPEGQLDQAVGEIVRVVEAEKQRVPPRRVDL